jgi:DNA replication and repair protein RecF
VLALRLAEVQEMEARTGDSPLVLLDDVASELDPSRKKRVLELLNPAWQTFMTTTRPDDFPPGFAFTDTICLPRDFESALAPEGI